MISGPRKPVPPRPGPPEPLVGLAVFLERHVVARSEINGPRVSMMTLASTSVACTEIGQNAFGGMQLSTMFGFALPGGNVLEVCNEIGADRSDLKTLHQCNSCGSFRPGGWLLQSRHAPPAGG